LQGRVAWIKRASLLGGPFEYGIQFVGVTGAVAKILDQIAMYGFVHDANGAEQKAPLRDAAPAPPTSAKRAPGSSGTCANASGASETAEGSTRPKVTVTADLPCFYATLGVAFDATEQQVRAAFRQLAKRLHPDVCKEPDASERFAFITRVYEVLSDDELRARYDEAIAKRRAA
jgi:hypothetical protein